MDNTILKPGHLVKYHIQSGELEDLGFVLGQYYEVKNQNGMLLVSAKKHDACLVMDGVLTKQADHFALHKCPVILPRGKAC